MISLQPASPCLVPSSIIERFFITKGSIPAGQPWHNTALPSIMQSIIIHFNAAGISIHIPKAAGTILSSDLVIGQHTKRFTTILEGEIDAIGIHFTPTGLFRVLQQPMYAFADRIQQLELFLPWYSSLKLALHGLIQTPDRIHAIETEFQKHFIEDVHLLNAIAAAAESIRNSNGTLSLAEIGKKNGLSERSMQRYFLQYIGVSPKAFARIARFNAVTKLIESGTVFSWQEVLMETGYFDRAHFNHDFKNITGLTPSEYYKGKTTYEQFFYGS